MNSHIEERKEHIKSSINSNLNLIAKQLHRIADVVEQNANDEGKPCSQKIQDVHHEIFWGMANLGLDNLIYKLVDFERIVKEDG